MMERYLRHRGSRNEPRHGHCPEIAQKHKPAPVLQGSSLAPAFTNDRSGGGRLGTGGLLLL
jgi:hypothetical protein